MACWAMQFTPCVTIAGRHELLLMEVQASLRLWGGHERLLSMLEQGWSNFGWQPPDTVTMACSSTARAAQWLALHHSESSICGQTIIRIASRPQDMALMLSELPLHVIDEARMHLEVLERMGIRHLGPLMRLPRKGITRRFGKDLPRALDAACGLVADPQRWLELPETFHSRRELPMRADHTEPIVHAARHCLHEFSGWLAARQSGVQSLQLILHHDDPPPTTITLGFAGITRDPARMHRVLGERLHRQDIPRSVYEIGIQARDILPLPHRTQDFLGGEADGADALQELIERLSARLGENHVQRLDILDEHRPEKAARLIGIRDITRTTRTCDMSVRQPHQAHRPAWLLHAPIPLPTIQYRPGHRGGPLRLLAGPERIEAGWWDTDTGGPVQRDYFIACSHDQELLWVFRTPDHHWYLHGVFS